MMVESKTFSHPCNNFERILGWVLLTNLWSFGMTYHDRRLNVFCIIFMLDI
jgi:hypothetical protein